MAVVIGHVVHDCDYEFVNQRGDTVKVSKGEWSVLSCRDGHIVPGIQPLGKQIHCPEDETGE